MLVRVGVRERFCRVCSVNGAADNMTSSLMTRTYGNEEEERLGDWETAAAIREESE